MESIAREVGNSSSLEVANQRLKDHLLRSYRRNFLISKVLSNPRSHRMRYMVEQLQTHLANHGAAKLATTLKI